MDQESFRRLLQTPNASASASAASRASFFTSGSKKAKVTDASQPSFKPRKVKKSVDERYRDRAAERRGGQGNDYAQVEAVLEDFEKRHVDSEDKVAVEEKRQYLGGDGDHSILVKGLDVALLEQNKARAALSTEDDDSLEKVFLEVSSESAIPKKRTREDLIRELKERRNQGGEVSQNGQKVEKTAEEEARILEEAKKKGKFKPIGAPDVQVKKKKKVKADGRDAERRKKRRKVLDDGTPNAAPTEETSQTSASVEPMTAKPPLPKELAVEPEPEPIPDDFDIFAGAGDYQGLDLGDDDDDNESDDGLGRTEQNNDVDEEPSASTHIRWIETDEAEALPTKPDQLLPGLKPEYPEKEDDEETFEQPTRLQPLESSALPSIKEFLAMDAAGSSGKRKKRKDKKKVTNDGNEEAKKQNAEAKVERDYKRLKSYTDKKAGAPK